MTLGKSINHAKYQRGTYNNVGTKRVSDPGELLYI